VKLIIGDTKVDNEIAELFFMLLILMIFFFVGVYYIPSISFAQTQETENVTSNATISKLVSIGRSNNLTAGILFGTVQTNTNDNNATGNFNSTNHTQFWITIDGTTTIPIDLCIKANDSLRSGSYTIALTNYHVSNSSTNAINFTFPLYPPTIDMSTSWQALFNDSWNSGTTTYRYLRFALTVPSGQIAGTYTNEISFRGIENTTGC